MIMDVVKLFEGLGAEVRSRREVHADDHRVDAVVDVVLDGADVRFAIEAKRRAPYIGEVRAMAKLHERLEVVGKPLLVAPYVSASLGDALSRERWSWVDAEGNADVRAPGLRVQRRVTSSPPKVDSEALPSGSGSWAIIRAAVLSGFVESATATSRQAGVSQPRASQVLARLTAAGYLERESRSKWSVDRERLLDAFLEQYGGPGGSTSWFYSLDPPMVVAKNLVESGAARSCELAVSGDVAADQLSPWRTPTQVTLYVTVPGAISELGVVAAQGSEDANVELIFPDDTSVFGVGVTGQLPLAHPTQVIWDLKRHGGVDRDEAAERVRAWLLSR
jgi:hypothetical protein